MLGYICKRVLYMVPTLLGMSLIAFLIIQLPPGDYLTSMIATMSENGQPVDPAQIERLKEIYGFDDPFYIQYMKWMWGILSRGDFGWSFEWNQPVSGLIWARMGSTLVISLLSLLFVWIVALPIGIYSAVRRHSVGDHVFTFLGFIGLAVPNFILALTLMYVAYRYLGQSVGGLNSQAFAEAPWSTAKVWDFLKHVWIPVIIIGASGTAALIRILRANLTDELHKPYVITARAKGLPEYKVILKYPVRIALNPFVSAIGWVLPHLVSGVTIIAIVLNLPTAGPLLFRALVSQDMYLAGSFILLLSALTLIGVLLSDLLLALLDPRIRFN
ncbi:Dipeptide transport system permease protein DppB [Rhizobium rhizogenes]|uniref:Dipeptide transport system permease protein DppB n=1 Tax=Rhizobium rhizogenes TaxID=359 RepID=A0AAN2DDK8_RHIRH|nr:MULTISPECIES: ABC transporter permease [Rhizobium/Agrobacterium group]AQS60846.1 ABC transporter permease [Rhizobium rhizogenes]MBO0126068.1 ABC transporter permease [Agrobacterium sp. OT33]MCZ7445178.1 ABC transporter permease [Rhizobium rhizogenes]NSZ80033.1 ABC transporter permease [Agrobacterium tumefaciens]OAM64136.1 ABC transporter permease [Rhizobium rhizogenes]